MNRKDAISGAALSMMALSCASQEAVKPNILYIMTDQQSYYMVSALVDQIGNSPYSGNHRFSTPNLDRLVKNGYAFTHCYAANPVSGPSRFALLTGESPKAYGMSGNYSPSGENGRRMCELLSTRAMGTLFRNAGYETVYAGKVHLPWAGGTGGKNSIYNPPTAYGFDKFLTYDDREELTETCVKYLDERQGDNPFLFFVSFMNPHDICMSRLLFGNNTVEDFEHNQRELSARRNQLKFRDLYQSMDQALFDSDTLVGPPDNMAPSEGYPSLKRPRGEMYSDMHKVRAHIWFYYRLVEQVDSMIGEVLDALERSPYADNTVVIFTSDHGEMAASHGFSGKNQPFEECQRVPFIFSGKGIRSGVVDDVPVCNGWDLLPTMLDIAGIEIPDALKGISLYGRMTSGAPIDRKYLYMESVNTYGVLDDGRFKYTRMEEPDPEFGAEALTDIEKDPGEKRNVVNMPEYASEVERLRKVLDEELAKFRRVYE